MIVFDSFDFMAIADVIAQPNNRNLVTIMRMVWQLLLFYLLLSILV
jgi:hypothetical protein